MEESRAKAVPIEHVDVAAYDIPTDTPESDGTLEWNKTTVVVTKAKAAGVCGLGYTYTNSSAAYVVENLLAGVVCAMDAMDVPGAWVAMSHAVRNFGRPGIGSAAIAAVDTALWDLKARLLNLPLAKLFGAVRKGVPVYGSGGFTSYSAVQLQTQLRGWAECGIRMVKVKVGRNPREDPERVRLARQAIGEDTELFVDANGAYDVKQASRLALEFAESKVCWFEEPVSSDDLAGLSRLRAAVPAGMEIAAGEYGYDLNYFHRMLQAGAVDVLQADATRCGGITGFLKVGALCEALCIPLSAHTAPSLHLPLGCALLALRHLEYFHDHVRVEAKLFDGVQTPVNGILYPDLTRPGLGLELRGKEAELYAAA